MRILVTGGSRGIGFAIAEELATRGHQLALVGRSEARLNAASERLRDAKPLTVAVDLARPGAACEIIEQLHARNFRPQVAVLAAGTFHEELLLEATPDHIQDQMQVNLLSQIELIQSLKDDLVQAKGRVIIIGSTAAFEPYAYGPIYGITKWALRGLAENLRAELRPYKVGVTLFHPGGTWTDLWDGADLPRNRLLEPRDIAQLVATMLELSPQAVVDEIVLRPIEGDMHD